MKSLKDYKALVVFDCETTGLDSLMNHIIELACVKYVWQEDRLVLSDSMDAFIRINYRLPLKIIQLTGITDQLLNQQGKEEKNVVDDLVNRFIDNDKSKTLFIAYNAHFDIGFVKQMLKRYQRDFPSHIDFLDVLTVYKDRAQYPHRLENAIKHYQLDHVQNSHRAIDDVLATFEVLKSMSANHDDLINYVNLFGYNPKYHVRNRIPGIRYKAQPYNSSLRLYQKNVF